MILRGNALYAEDGGMNIKYESGVSAMLTAKQEKFVQELSQVAAHDCGNWLRRIYCRYRYAV